MLDTTKTGDSPLKTAAPVQQSSAKSADYTESSTSDAASLEDSGSLESSREQEGVVGSSSDTSTEGLQAHRSPKET